MRAIRFSDLERTVLEQHEEIRARILGLLQNAERTELPWALDAVRVLLVRFAARFDAHLQFEERELVPRLRTLDAWGPVREAAVLAEHLEQRRRIERVCALAEDTSAPEPSGLLAAIAELAHTLLEDMRHEEKTLDQLTWIDENGQADQMTG